jgi:hypothetical protein
MAAMILLSWALAAVVAIGVSQPGHAPLTARDLAEYRLTTPAFERFVRASRGVAEATTRDAALAANPPFSREVTVLGDVSEVAPALESRFIREPALAAALAGAKISARDYTTFALALVGARLAHGFVKSGAMRFVPPGVASDNVAFITAHEAEVAAVLMLLGIE